MEDTYKDRTSLVKGAKDIAKEVKRQTVKKVNKTIDKAQDGYTQRSYKQFKDEEDDDDYYTQGGSYDGEANDDEGSSEATEGHDEDDEIYEGEYQGIPNTGQGKDGIVAREQPIHDEYKDRHELETERKADEEELAQQYELIIQECGHGRFQWALFFVLGMALMADGVEVFVVGFVLPSAETDMCIPNSGSGWLEELPMSIAAVQTAEEQLLPVAALFPLPSLMVDDSVKSCQLCQLSHRHCTENPENRHLASARGTVVWSGRGESQVVLPLAPPSGTTWGRSPLSSSAGKRGSQSELPPDQMLDPVPGASSPFAPTRLLCHWIPPLAGRLGVAASEELIPRIFQRLCAEKMLFSTRRCPALMVLIATIS
ncbi:Synaptic vesicle glycoprotein 2C [Chelonia mydas]|uniref:Synaptic vesicle glycoprotein 2C n=1 Tax=Chelonia mydas TaxID=8469 RepID=M7B7C2_CHEMY|nr:Synaptic vesicle glycoprotein 2C [Chelonia mydas]